MTTNKCLKYRKIAGEYYLIPVGEAAEKWKSPLQLTETGALIWTMLEKGKHKDEITARMTEEYEVDPDRAGKALESFCLELLRIGLLVENV